MEIARKYSYTITIKMNAPGESILQTRSREGGVKSFMQVEVKIDSTCKEPKIIVVADQMTDEISALVRRLSGGSARVLSGFRGDTLEVLEQSDISRIFASAGKVFAATAKGEYALRLRLYEFINLEKVKNFDLSFTGTICVSMTDGAVTYVSRRYVNKIKQVLGI